jgi:hypothetical protein
MKELKGNEKLVCLERLAFRAWPVAETFHFVGFGILLGPVCMLDLRVLGFVKAVPLAPMHRLIQFGVAGFIVNAVTGALFFIAQPGLYVANVAFFYKLVFIFLAGVNVLLFYFTVYGRIKDLGPGENAPTSAKLIAVTSLFLWIGVVFFGRMLPYIGNSF